MNLYQLFILSLIAFISACSTPPEIKQLSLKQLDYINVLTTAVTVQSEGLLSVAEKLRREAEGKIGCYQQNSIDRLNTLMSDTIPSMDRDKRIETKRNIFLQAESINNSAESSRKKLAIDFVAIQKKTEELHDYLKKIKSMQLILNTYIQSETISDQLLTSTLGLGDNNVSTFLQVINTNLPKIKSTTRDLKILLDVLTNNIE